MVGGKDATGQNIFTVIGVFVLVCGGVLVVARSALPAAPLPPAAVEMRRHADEASAALEERNYERAKASIEAMCSQVESLDEGPRPRTEPSRAAASQ